MNKHSSTSNNQHLYNLLTDIKQCENLFMQVIRDRLGIIIHHHQINELNKTIIEACKKFNCSPQEYLKEISYCSNHSPLLEHLVLGITIGETYFFRDKTQMEFLQNDLLPNLIASKRKQENLALRIWSAGCSSGEEIYSIAMLIHELLPDINKWTLNLLGTDINTVVLQKAMMGHYSEWSMRSIQEFYKKKYFSLVDKQYVLNKEICDLVKFDYLNLNDDSYPSIFNATNAQDLILCRNVLIYFDNNRITRLMQKLSESLIPGGYLLLGASDPIDIHSTNLIFHHDKHVFFSRPEEKLNIPEIEQIPIAPIRKSQSITIPKPKLPVSHKPIKKVVKMNEEHILNLMKEARWEEILTEMFAYENESQPSVVLLNAKATALANLGKLVEAQKIFQETLRLDPTNKYSYFTYALILIELNDLNHAEKALRKTLFLDHQFVEGHYQLGLLLLRNKFVDAGLKSLRNALSIAKTKTSTETMPGSQQLSYGQLAEILEHEIDIYTTSGNNDHAYESDKQKA